MKTSIREQNYNQKKTSQKGQNKPKKWCLGYTLMFLPFRKRLEKRFLKICSENKKTPLTGSTKYFLVLPSLY